MRISSFLHLVAGFVILAFALPSARGESPVLRVAVLDDAPPLAYRAGNGSLTGFANEIMRSLCADMQVTCEFVPVSLEHVVDELAAGQFDVAAIGLLATAERQQRILFTRPVYRSMTMFFAREGTKPGQKNVRLSVFKGSAQEGYARREGWDYVGAASEIDIVEQLEAGISRYCLVPLMTSVSLQRNPRFAALGLQAQLLPVSELSGDAAFGVAPGRRVVKDAIDQALERIKRNGVYDRINSQFLPLRVN